MKKLFPFTTAILLTFVSYSQVSEGTTEYAAPSVEKEEIVPTKHRIGINIGGSSPKGEYSAIDQNEESSGYADGGISVGLSYQYNMHESFAVSFLYGSTANKFNAQAFVDQLSREEPNVNWRVEADPYSVGFVMVGVKGFIGDQVKAYVNPMFGYGIMTSPNVQIIASNGANSISQQIRESDPEGSGILGVSFGIDFLVSELISINIDGTYLNSEFEIERVLDTFDPNGRPQVVRVTNDQPYEVLNFSLGIGFNF
ncbi:MAG: outer membrane beta-barrel protein [Vicingaceae bacterium]